LTIWEGLTFWATLNAYIATRLSTRAFFSDIATSKLLDLTGTVEKGGLRFRGSRSKLSWQSVPLKCPACMGALKLQDKKMKDIEKPGDGNCRKMTTTLQGVENSGLEKDGQKCRW